MIAISPGHWRKGSSVTGYIDEVEEARKVVKDVARYRKYFTSIVEATVATCIEFLQQNRRK